MASLASIRSAVSTAVSSVTGFQESAYQLANPTPNSFLVGLSDTRFTQSMSIASGHHERTMFVEVYVGAGSDVAMQKQLDEILDVTGSKSVYAAIMADPTLGGVVDYCHCTDATEPQLYLKADGQSAAWGCRINLRVLHS